MPSPELSVRAKDYTRIITIKHCRKAPKAENPDFTAEGSKAAAAPSEVLDVLRGEMLRLGAPEVVGPIVGDVMVLPPATEVSAGDDWPAAVDDRFTVTVLVLAGQDAKETPRNQLSWAFGVKAKPPDRLSQQLPTSCEMAPQHT